MTDHDLAARQTAAIRDRLHDVSEGYPANWFAFEQVIPRMRANGTRTVVEVGVGHGNALPIFIDAGFTMAGFDIRPELATASAARLAELGGRADAVVEADIEAPGSYASIAAHGPFDALLAMGVLPHVRDEHQTLVNMRELVRPGGEVYVECRNSLFSLFTFNRYTHEFILDELLPDAPEELRALVDSEIQPRLSMDRPPLPASGAHAPRFHNPLAVPALFRRAGFVDVEVLPFHFHAGLPKHEQEAPQLFRDASIALESDESGWRGLFLCSAFVVRARRSLEQAR